jgi:hypothetical protein
MIKDDFLEKIEHRLPVSDKKSSKEIHAFSIKHILTETLSESTIHGIYDIYKINDYFLKAFIIICFLGSAGICCYLTVTTFIAYFSYGVLSTATVISDIPAECKQKNLKSMKIFKHSLNFIYLQNKVPAISICNLNQFDMNWAADVVDFAYDGTINQFNPNDTANDYLNDLNDYIRSNLVRKYLSNLFYLYNNQFLLSQMLLSCRFQKKECGLGDFMFYYDTYYGLCHRFNFGRTLRGNVTPIRTSGKVGWRYGLQMELYVGRAEIQEKFIANRGFRVIIFNRSNAIPIGEDIGVNIPTGQETNIGIRRTFTNHLSSPYSNCLPTDIAQIDWSQNPVLQFMYDNFIVGQYYWSTDIYIPAGNWTWNWTVSYSQSVCVKMCFQKYLFAMCGKP